MGLTLKILCSLAIIMAFAFTPAPALADDQAEESAKKAGDIAARILHKDARNKKRVYTTKKLYEDDKIIIYRGYDSDGKKYTVTKKK